jgi:hypothetical protein
MIFRVIDLVLAIAFFAGAIAVMVGWTPSASTVAWVAFAGAARAFMGVPRGGYK